MTPRTAGPTLQVAPGLAKAFWRKVASTGMKERTCFNQTSVDRLASLDGVDLMEEYIIPGRAVVILGEVLKWGNLSQWRPAYLDDKIGSKYVDVAVSQSRVFRYGPREAASSARMTFREALQKIQAAHPEEAVYVMQQPIAAQFPELESDIQPPDYAGANAAAHLWFGGANNVTPLHFDALCNLFGQVFGRKRFLIYSPKHLEEMYPLPVDAPFSHVSPVNAENPDFLAHPRFEEAQCHEVVLAPGDVLFLPPFWWHCVRSLDVSISVNFWWPPSLQHCLVPAGLRLLHGSYALDRLQTAGVPFRGPDGFMGAAQEMMARGLYWPAILLAGAEVESAVRDMARLSGIDDHADGSPKTLSFLNRDLLAAKAYDSAIADWILSLDFWFATACQEPDLPIGLDETRLILDAVAKLFPRPAKAEGEI